MGFSRNGQINKNIGGIQMNITFVLHNGVSFAANIQDFNSAQFAKELNNPQVLFVSVGNGGFQKNSLANWYETPQETPTV